MMIIADNDNSPNMSTQNVPITGLGDVHLLSPRIYILIIPILHMRNWILGYVTYLLCTKLSISALQIA